MPATKSKAAPVGNRRGASPVVVSTTDEFLPAELAAGTVQAEAILANGGSQELASKMALDTATRLRDERKARFGAEAAKRAEAEAERRAGQVLSVGGIIAPAETAETLKAQRADANLSALKVSVANALGALKANLTALGADLTVPNPAFDADSPESAENPATVPSDEMLALGVVAASASRLIAARMTTIEF